jgi:hypothetical protein
VRLLVTGGTGALGRAFCPLAEAEGHQVSAPGRAELDLFDPAAVGARMRGESRGHLGAALEIAGDAVRRADASPGRLGHRFPVRVTQGRLLIALDRLPEARSALSAGVRASEELGVRWALATHRVYLAYERFAAGDWDDALAELEVRTVQTHLAHVFAKLDISTRTQLAAEVTRRRPV